LGAFAIKSNIFSIFFIHKHPLPYLQPSPLKFRALVVQLTNEKLSPFTKLFCTTTDEIDGDEGDDDDDDAATPDASGAAKKKKKKNRKKKPAAASTTDGTSTAANGTTVASVKKQTVPPTVPVHELYPNGVFPRGEEFEYKNE
jgi:hypothetical protein